MTKKIDARISKEALKEMLKVEADHAKLKAQGPTPRQDEGYGGGKVDSTHYGLDHKGFYKEKNYGGKERDTEYRPVYTDAAKKHLGTMKEHDHPYWDKK